LSTNLVGRCEESKQQEFNSETPPGQQQHSWEHTNNSTHQQQRQRESIPHLDVGPHGRLRQKNSPQGADHEEDLRDVPVPEKQLEDRLSISPHQSTHQTGIHKLNADREVHLPAEHDCGLVGLSQIKYHSVGAYMLFMRPVCRVHRDTELDQNGKTRITPPSEKQQQQQQRADQHRKEACTAVCDMHVWCTANQTAPLGLVVLFLGYVLLTQRGHYSM